MKDTYVSARLISPDTIRLVFFSENSFSHEQFTLIIDHEKRVKLTISKNINLPAHTFLEFKLRAPLELGHSYFVDISSFGAVPLDVKEATGFPNFDSDFFYPGHLGAEYRKNSTKWTLWAPLASDVKLILKTKMGDYSYPMVRGANGSWEIVLEGDYLLACYQYLVTNNEVALTSIDPYGKASTANGKESVVIDEKSMARRFDKSNLPPIASLTDCVIYEGNVRDLTVDKHNTILQKGTYAGLAEKGRTTKKGNPFGLDYLKSLGITHLQLQPLNDFGSVDELRPFSQYNWGYDPTQYFTPEGSYSLSPNDPIKRLKEVQDLVDSLHQEGIRVVVDVVFNHVYDYLFSSLEKCVPNYYFRKMPNGRISNSSGCGNDIDSERPMVRRLIMDACDWWVDFYGIDGFRFDLMGLLDARTIATIQANARSKDPNFILYGEGWNMFCPTKATMANLDHASRLPAVGFFNDRFRENVKAFCAGDLTRKDAFIYSMIGSCYEYSLQSPMFGNGAQSLNYIECHDNGTYYDYLSKNGGFKESDKLEICKLGMAATIFAFGMPFIHEGQEIAQSKFGNENTYNLGDIYNKLSDKLLDERIEMTHYLRGAIQLRKSLAFYSETDPDRIAAMVDFEEFGEGLMMKVKDLSLASPYQEVEFLFNVTSDSLTYSFKEDRRILFTSGGSALGAAILGRNVLVPKHSVLVTALLKD